MIRSDSQLSLASTVCATSSTSRKRRHLVIVADFGKPVIAQPANEPEAPVQKKKVTKAYLCERAKSGRSVCKKCKKTIQKGEMRVGLLTFYPHRNVKWFHAENESGCADQLLAKAKMDEFWGLKELAGDDKDTLESLLEAAKLKQSIIGSRMTLNAQALPVVSGQLDMPRFASAITERYDRFRSFRFGLPETEKYGKNWRWRCLLATMLVCNTHETAMLAFTDKLFLVYKTPEDLEKLRGDKKTTKAWMDYADKMDLRHSGKKMTFILRANKLLLDKYDGDVPKERDELEVMNGVGRHVASITMAWCYQRPEFGIDVHVKRILTRWGYVNEGMSDIQIENKVKTLIPEKQIGHFSRAFVDHGQQVCGYTPNCSECYLKHSCPTAAKYMDW